MICPWLIKIITDTDNKNNYNNSRRTEHQEFDRCMESKCPFYEKLHGKDNSGIFSIEKCTRVEIEKRKYLPVE